MGRRLAALTLDSLPDLPDPCRRCVLWELEPVAARTRLVNPGSTFGSKTTVGMRCIAASSIIGPEAYPPTPKAALKR